MNSYKRIIPKKKNEEKKLHMGFICMFLGEVSLILSDGSYLGIANNSIPFLAAIMFNLLPILVGKSSARINYVSIVLMYILGITWCYYSIGIGDRGTALSLMMFPVLLLSVYFVDYTNRDIDILVDGIVISGVIFSVLILFYGNPDTGALEQKYTYTQSWGKHIQFEPNFYALWILCGFEFSVYKILKLLNRRKRSKMIKNNASSVYFRRYKQKALRCAVKNKRKGRRRNRLPSKKIPAILWMWYTFAAVLCMIAMFRTGARSVLMSGVVLFMCLALFIENRRVKRSFVLIALILIVLLFFAIYLEIIPTNMYERFFKNSYNDGSNQKRLTNWYYGLKATWDTFIGCGPITSVQALYTLYNYPADAHNTFINFGVCYGVPGIVIFTAFIIYLAVMLWKHHHKELFSILISLIVQWNVVSAIYTFGMWQVLLIIIMRLEKDRRNKEKMILKGGNANNDKRSGTYIQRGNLSKRMH